MPQRKAGMRRAERVDFRRYREFHSHQTDEQNRRPAGLVGARLPRECDLRRCVTLAFYAGACEGHRC